MFRILIVCTGNICRSPMAEGILRSLLSRHDLGREVEVRSAGTWGRNGGVASPHAVAVSAAHGVAIDAHRASALTPALIADADLILVMEPTHLEDVLAKDSAAEGKTFVVTTFADPEEGDPAGVDDPFGTDLDSYEATFEQLDHVLRVAMPRILARIEDSGREWRGAEA